MYSIVSNENDMVLMKIYMTLKVGRRPGQNSSHWGPKLLTACMRVMVA
jgi:hypothetical protein